SYANIAAKNAPPPEQQPYPDPALLTTPSSLGGATPDGVSKITVVPPRSREPSTTTTSDRAGRPSESTSEDSTRRRPEAQTSRRWEKVKDIILRPSVAGGLVGIGRSPIVNIGLLAGASYAFYVQPRLRHDTKIITSALAAAFVLFRAESYTAKACRSTFSDKAAEREVEERPLIDRRGREHALRPCVLGGTIGFVNVGVLTTVGYLGYSNWNNPGWDKRTVSAASVGLAAL
ncbi:hypothetical protein BJV78DRAFT_1097026, partial [Lactifluus subvellereus]